MKIRINMELEFVDYLVDTEDAEEYNWLKDDILPSATVAIFSDEIGDYITKDKTITDYIIITK